jgi:EAL domain-containing protein (putative c-di-GMP-specific phosphodiesterase class I)/GGDEF domain-containing protein
MQPPAIPENEAARLLELCSFDVLDTPADSDVDDISELARRLAGTEIGIISLVDQDRQWFKSCVGAALGQEQTPRSISFCGHTILQREPLIIADALLDPRFADNPLVTGEPGIRFYAGFPLISPNGFGLGSLCAISRQPHQLAPQQIDSLQRLAKLAVHHLSSLREANLLRSTEEMLKVERLKQSNLRGGYSSLDQLMSREQMLQAIELSMAMQVESSFALLRCRFRDYDRINATLGGGLAEEFLNEGARRVLAALPRGTSVARFAESELVVFLPSDGDATPVQRAAERIISFINQPYRTGSQSLPMGLAIGIATYQRDYDSVEALLADTSMAVRMAMRSTASAFRFIDADTRVLARDTYRLESDLREALNQRLLETYLQPIVDLHTNEPIGFEALARWQRGSELISPGYFLPMLSEAGVTGELDLLIIEKALAAIPLLALPIPQRPMTMSVNLSGVLLEEDELRRRLLHLIEENPLPVGWTLQVELLEDAFQDTSESFDQFLLQLVERSVTIAIDDFGTGYSSLARLISLPINSVKVDRAFIHRLDESNESPRTLLRTMLTMLGDLGLSVTAEGVETASQKSWLIEQGVSKAQGYLFHRPQPINEAIDLLQGLDYRPSAVPVDPRRLQEMRRRRRKSLWRLPFLDRRQ